MGLPSVLEGVRKRPGMYLRAVRYDVVVAFVQGFDAAQSGGLLVGFREWLIPKVDGGNNLSWPELVLRLMTLRAQPDQGQATEAESQEVSVEFMFSMLEDFLQERGSGWGLRRIYFQYDQWLRKQEWYGPLSPEWLPENGESEGY